MEYPRENSGERSSRLHRHANRLLFGVQGKATISVCESLPVVTTGDFVLRS
ncbi:hypothetical protein WN48_10270 [Eufriesea mexicana]|uniref:Uncharacterized protein n=1 Tax=Eufriesea mexicana TaxID=516756 RepID=A0A310SIX2_9HYME|nr:hypothetical protein WN48_10270 [Eufriesea mexicana]